MVASSNYEVDSKEVLSFFVFCDIIVLGVRACWIEIRFVTQSLVYIERPSDRPSYIIVFLWTNTYVCSLCRDVS
jgi:hypothetical protein